jgi:hypothetical protein
MRIRTVKPEFWAHPVYGRLSDLCKWLAVGLLSYADDEGYFFAEPELIRASLWPFSGNSPEDYRRLTEALQQLRMVGWYEHSDSLEMGQIGRIAKWSKHQKISHPSTSKIKAYWNPESFRKLSGVSPEILRPEQGTGNREQGSIALSKEPLSTEKKSRLKSSELPEDFKLFWDAYGKKVNVKKALHYWSQLSPDEISSCMGAVGAYVASREKIHRLDPERYLRDRRWQDEIILPTSAGTHPAKPLQKWLACPRCDSKPERILGRYSALCNASCGATRLVVEAETSAEARSLVPVEEDANATV